MISIHTPYVYHALEGYYHDIVQLAHSVAVITDLTHSTFARVSGRLNHVDPHTPGRSLRIVGTVGRCRTWRVSSGNARTLAQPVAACVP
jgi:hypothetical protein